MELQELKDEHEILLVTSIFKFTNEKNELVNQINTLKN